MKPIGSDGMESKPHGPHPEEPCEARRLEGGTPARSRLWPSFETRARARSSGRGSAGRLRGRPFAAAAAVLAWCLAQSAALAQTPYVPEEWKYGKRQDGAALNYCVDERDPDLPVAKEIGRAVAQALLLQPKEHAIGQNTVGEDIDNLYRVFLETCDVFLGFKLISDAYPQWMAITRPYYRA